MAGLGSRFAAAGYKLPKPLIEIDGVRLYRLVLGNLVASQLKSVTVVAQKNWNLQEEIDQIQSRLRIPVELIEIDYVTSGAATTVSLGLGKLNPHSPVVVANCDQYVVGGCHSFYEAVATRNPQGTIMTMEASDPKWSYVRLNKDGKVGEVVEKRVVSKHATTGIYGFSTAHELSEAIKAQSDQNFRVNGEFYLAPVYNQLIRRRIVPEIFELPRADAFYGLGTPEDLELFMRTSHLAGAIREAV